jgi:uncharacterized protein YggU (UPF0235/DUF167 family)
MMLITDRRSWRSQAYCSGVCPEGAQVRRRTELRGEQDGMLKVCVTQSPEKGKANKAVIELMAKSLGLRKSQIELLSGETSHQKRFLIRGITPDELAQNFAEKMK